MPAETDALALGVGGGYKNVLVCLNLSETRDEVHLMGLLRPDLLDESRSNIKNREANERQVVGHKCVSRPLCWETLDSE